MMVIRCHMFFKPNATFFEQIMNEITHTASTVFATCRCVLWVAAVTLVALAATGCAAPTGPEFQAVETPPVGKGQIYIYRTANALGINGAGTGLPVTLD